MTKTRGQNPQINVQPYDDPQQWSDAIINGDVLAASRLMRYLDDQISSAKDVMMSLFQHMGNAHIVGVTGPPGTGKSTFITPLVKVPNHKLPLLSSTMVLMD